LGFITADGCVIGDTLSIALNPKDSGHLKKLLISLNSDVPVHHYTSKNTKNKKEYEYCRIRIRSKKMTESLYKLGITERKSFTAEPCKNIPKRLQAAYWRGIIDGDGSIRKDKTGMWRISLCGSEMICHGFKEWTNKFVNSNVNVIKEKRIFAIYFGGNKIATSIIGKLYNNARIYLDRKYNIADAIGLK